MEGYFADQLPQEQSRGLHVGRQRRAEIAEIRLDDGCERHGDRPPGWRPQLCLEIGATSLTGLQQLPGRRRQDALEDRLLHIVQVGPGVGELGLEAIAGVRLGGRQPAKGRVDLPGEVAHDLWGEHFFKNELEQRLLKANPVDLAIILAHDSAAIAVSRTAVILARVAPPVHAR